MVERPTGDEHAAALALIAEQQGDRTRRLACVGDDLEGIAGELATFDPPFDETVRIVRSHAGGVEGVCGIEWDVELGRAWIVGPWVRADGEAWQRTARTLVEAVVAQAPDAVTRFELAGEDVAADLAALADGLGWAAGEANHILIADEATVTGWPTDPLVGVEVRSATSGDEAAIAGIHDVEFPDTHSTSRRLIDEATAGERTTLVAEVDGEVAGYASGQVHGDGEAFIDFLGVRPEARGRGLGAALVHVLGRDLLAASSLCQVALTVQDHRTDARALYARLGFTSDGTMVAYRSWA